MRKEVVARLITATEHDWDRIWRILNENGFDLVQNGEVKSISLDMSAPATSQPQQNDLRK